MKYQGQIVCGKFLKRPNRFIAIVEIEGQEMECHVKNTGRCKELLVLGATVFLEEGNNPNRRTKYSLIAVYKGKRLINMDSQAPNAVAYEWVKEGGLRKDILSVKREVTFGKSRFDLYCETKDEKIFIEVKGVTLEDNGVVRFPDAPTQRGVKHIYELCKAIEEGYKAYVLFVVQMSDVKYFEPNDVTHQALGDALRYGREKGLKILAVDCRVTPETLEIGEEILVQL